jgi:hypothetical protein
MGAVTELQPLFDDEVQRVAAGGSGRLLSDELAVIADRRLF